MKNMMKKIFAMLLTVAMLLTCAAMGEAKTYTNPDNDLSFTYDDAVLEISLEDKTDDELMVVLNGKDAAWGNAYVKIHLADLDGENGDTFPTLADFAEMEAGLNTTVTQGDWNGFKDVFSYTIDDGDSLEKVFIAPVCDDDNEVEDILTITIGIDRIANEEASMNRDDAISAVLDSLKILED